MKNTGNESVFVHAPAFENFFDSEGMRNERLATFAELAFVSFGGEIDCALNFICHI